MASNNVSNVAETVIFLSVLDEEGLGLFFPLLFPEQIPITNKVTLQDRITQTIGFACQCLL